MKSKACSDTGDCRRRTGLSSTSFFAVAGVITCVAILSFAQPLQAAPGNLDPSFGNGGRVLTKFAPQGLVGQTDAAFAMAIQSDGKIVVAGLSSAGRSSTFTFEFALARYSPDGTLDEGFGTDGNVLTPFSPDSNDKAFAIALLPDG